MYSNLHFSLATHSSILYRSQQSAPFSREYQDSHIRVQLSWGTGVLINYYTMARYCEASDMSLRARENIMSIKIADMANRHQQLHSLQLFAKLIPNLFIIANNILTHKISFIILG